LSPWRASRPEFAFASALGSGGRAPWPEAGNALADLLGRALRSWMPCLSPARIGAAAWVYGQRLVEPPQPIVKGRATGAPGSSGQSETPMGVSEIALRWGTNRKTWRVSVLGGCDGGYRDGGRRYGNQRPKRRRRPAGDRRVPDTSGRYESSSAPANRVASCEGSAWAEYGLGKEKEEACDSSRRSPVVKS
jgi:hypothetical protein